MTFYVKSLIIVDCHCIQEYSNWCDNVHVLLNKYLQLHRAITLPEVVVDFTLEGGGETPDGGGIWYRSKEI